MMLLIHETVSLVLTFLGSMPIQGKRRLEEIRSDRVRRYRFGPGYAYFPTALIAFWRLMLSVFVSYRRLHGVFAERKRQSPHRAGLACSVGHSMQSLVLPTHRSGI